MNSILNNIDSKESNTELIVLEESNTENSNTELTIFEPAKETLPTRFKNKNEFELDKLNATKLAKFKENNTNGLLLLESPKEDLSILTRIGLDNSIQETLEAKRDIDALNGLNTIYGKPVYLASDIRELCLKYNLKILRADKFYGQVDVSLAKIVKDFSETNKNINLGINSFFVLAPAENFDHNNPHKSNDLCTVFYRETNGSNTISVECDKLIKIHSWGDDYSNFRKLHFMLNPKCVYDSDESYVWFTYGFCLISILLFVGCFIFDNPILNVFIQTFIWGLRYFTTSIKGLDYYKQWCKY